MADSSNRYRTHPFQGCNTSSSLVSVTIPLRLKVGHLFLAQVMGVRFSQRKSYASVAQLVECRSEEPGVASSILAGGSNTSVSFNGRTPVFEAENGSSILPTEIIKYLNGSVA